MAKQYQCRDCKRPFQNQFALTAHIRFCRKKNKAKCPECGKLCNKRGLGSHRLSMHKVAGTSRWALSARKVKKAKNGPRDRMADLVQTFAKKPFFQEIMKEWAIHVMDAIESKTVDATTFANLYLEMMRDPRNDEARQGCAAFATFMKPRNWKKILEALRPSLDSETLAVFETVQAEDFYKQFKTMVLEQITGYWEQFLKAAEAPDVVNAVVPSWKEVIVKELTERISFLKSQTEELEKALATIQKC